MATYTYQENDEKIKEFASKFVSRIGDNSGPADQDYFDMVRLLFSMKQDGSLLDIGAGLGRVTQIAKEIMAETVALEPDKERWQQCHAGSHQPPKCQVFRQFSSEYIKNNPEKTFDIVVVSMVIQHVSTTVCQGILKDAASLLKPDGVGIIFTTHIVEEAKGFSFSQTTPDEAYVSEQQFNEYADDYEHQTKGIPVRRFTKAELLECLKPYFEALYWRQGAYYREDCATFFEKRFRLEAGALKDSGINQFVVVRKSR
jgi:2-polyprenyl-3-methyl-5-hydroxy-6-metoxy-1,4-benzoquinol methylase